MAIYLLKARDDLGDEDNPWEPWFDKNFALAVVARSEDEARRMAHEFAADENRGEFLGHKVSETKEPWLHPEYSTCRIVDPNEESKVLVIDCAEA